MSQAAQLVVFELGGQPFALQLSAVERVVPAAELTPLPQAPPGVLGLLNLHGRVLPVFDLHQCFGWPARAVSIADQIIIATTSRRAVGLWVDAVRGVIAGPALAPVAAETLLPHLRHVAGVVKCGDGLVLIEDLEQLLAPAEEDQLAAALATQKTAS